MTECYSSERQISLKFSLNVSQPQTDRLSRFHLHVRAFSFSCKYVQKKYTESLAALSVVHTHVQFKDVKAVKCS